MMSFLCRSSLSNFIEIDPQVDEKIERLLFSATTGVIFILKVALSGSDTGGLNATAGMTISPAATENKGCSIWGFAIRPKRTVLIKRFRR